MSQTTPDIRQLSYCCGTQLKWQHIPMGGEPDGYGGRCSCGMEWSELLEPARMLLATERLLLARIAEIEAVLANERGEGEPPVDGWEWEPDVQQWVLDGDGGGLYVFRRPKGWTWDGYLVSSGMPHFGIARDAMRAASGVAL